MSDPYLAAPSAHGFLTEDVRLLTDLGFLALSRGLDRHALAIFEAVRALRPAQEAGPIGIAMVHMYRGELQPAITLLRSLKPSDAALTFLGIALTRQGEHADAQKILADVIDSAPDSAYADIARQSRG